MSTRRDVIFDRAVGDEELICDLDVGEALCEECQDLGLSSRQSDCMVTGGERPAKGQEAMSQRSLRTRAGTKASTPRRVSRHTVDSEAQCDPTQEEAA
jgi:hypothetical protein